MNQQISAIPLTAFNKMRIQRARAMHRMAREAAERAAHEPCPDCGEVHEGPGVSVHAMRLPPGLGEALASVLRGRADDGPDEGGNNGGQVH